MSTPDVFSTVGGGGGGVDTMSTTEGYHEYSGGVQYSGEIP